MVKIPDVLVKILPEGVSNVLNDFVKDLIFSRASVGILTKPEFSVNNFLLDITGSTSISVDSESKSVSLGSLKILFERFDNKPKLQNEGQSGTGTEQPKSTTDPVVPLTKSKFELTALLVKGSAKAQISLDCLSNTEGTSFISMRIQPPDGSKLSVTALLDLLTFGTAGMILPLPADCPDMFTVNISYVGGTLEKSPGQGGKQDLKLRSFRFSAQSENKLPILDSPSIALDNLKIDVNYNSASVVPAPKGSGEAASTALEDLPGLQGEISGRILIGKAELWVGYSKKGQDDPGLFNGVLKLPPTTVTFGNIIDAAKFPNEEKPSNPKSMPKDVDAAGELDIVNIGAAFVPKTSLEIWGSGSSVWSTECSGISVSLNKVRVLARITFSQAVGNEKAKTIYSLSASGELVVKGFITAEAYLAFGNARNTVLSAVLQKSDPQSKDELKSLFDGASADPQSKWEALVPTETNPLTFENTGIGVRADFTIKKFILFGKIVKFGSALFMTKKPSKENAREYLFMFVAQDVSAIWSSLQSDITSKFRISPVAIQIINYNTTIEELKKDLELPADALQDPNVSPQENNPSSTTKGTDKGVNWNVLEVVKSLPNATKIDAGAWFFAVISIEDNTQPMSDVINVGANPGTKPTITLYASTTGGPKKTQYGIDVRNLKLLGGVLSVDGQGKYVPTDSLLQLEAQVVLELKPHLIHFDVKLDMKPELTHFEMATDVKSTDIVKNPCDEMFNVTLKSLTIKGDIVRKTGESAKSSYTLTGIALIGEQEPQTQLSAGIYYVEGNFQMILLQYEPATPVDITEIFNKILNPGASEQNQWDSTNYDSLVFTKASLSYAASDFTLEMVLYQKGYTFSAQMEIFTKPFSIWLTLPKGRSGFKLTGVYNGSIDLGFAEIISPGLGIDTTTKGKVR